MSQGCRRSSRLRASSWLYNWPKKPPVYIDLESAEKSDKKIQEMGRCLRKSTNKMTMDAEQIDIRSEWGKGKQNQNDVVSDVEEVFVTPCEMLSKSGEFGLVDSTNLVKNMDLSTLHEGQIKVSRSKVRPRVNIESFLFLGKVMLARASVILICVIAGFGVVYNVMGA